MPPKKDVITNFKVRGRGPFPCDMLRYDRAWPVDTLSALKLIDVEPDSDQVSETYKTRTIELYMYDPRNLGPTKERWSSFGWFVVNPDFDE